MEIGKEESNVQNAQLSMQELYGKNTGTAFFTSGAG